MTFLLRGDKKLQQIPSEHFVELRRRLQSKCEVGRIFRSPKKKPKQKHVGDLLVWFGFRIQEETSRGESSSGEDSAARRWVGPQHCFRPAVTTFTRVIMEGPGLVVLTQRAVLCHLHHMGPRDVCQQVIRFGR